MYPLVSVIIPVYQVSDYIERCLNSVMSQTYKNIECVLVDDVTKDDSVEKCERLIESYHGSMQFKILHHEVNRGLSAARNTGTDAATGEYIYFLDSGRTEVEGVDDRADQGQCEKGFSIKLFLSKAHKKPSEM